MHFSEQEPEIVKIKSVTQGHVTVYWVTGIRYLEQLILQPVFMLLNYTDIFAKHFSLRPYMCIEI